MDAIPNPQIELAFDYIQYTNKNIFLTGKAGTGKTTFLHRVKKESIKRTVVVAPTGVAAINAKGMTIHSFFQLPFGPIVPGAGRDTSQQRRFAKKKINLIKSLDLLIIDEISMVRADVLDGIDEVLRRYKDYSKPFGGVQLLMIGDLHQLPPVVKPAEWDLLRSHYDTAYFFGSLALKQTNPISIELKHIYRQSDGDFIELLSKVRNNQLDRTVLEAINSRYIPNFQIPEEEPFITLTSHNAAAATINKEQLNSIDGKSHHFSATITGDFPKHAYPTEEKLEFKKGAQVLFIKNDISPEKLYYNGKIGQITRIDGDDIYVKCPGDSELICVSNVEWKNIKYTLDETTKEVTEEEIGSFKQYPLKLAWAITIHKSQGLTFERAIIDAQAAFAHGQVYVALSRCKSFEGIVLRSKIDFSSVRTDAVVKGYSEEASKNEPSEADLEQSKKEYQQSLIRELFDFKDLKYNFNAVHRIYLEHENTLTTVALNQFKELADLARTTVIEIGEKFQPQLGAYFRQESMPVENEALQVRLQKASVYFLEKLEKIAPDLSKMPILSDSKTVTKKAVENLEKLEKALFTKINCIKISAKGFSVENYVKTKTNADLDFVAMKRKTAISLKSIKVPKNILHPKLYKELSEWREEKATENDVTSYEVLPSRSLVELVHALPRDSEGLLKIIGIGKVKVKQYGAEILAIVDNYCDSNDIQSDLLMMPLKTAKPNTKKVSLDLFLAGKTIDEIAKERKFVRSTIEGHLGHFVGLGVLDIFKLMEKEKVEEIEQFFMQNDVESTTEARGHFGEKYSYTELRWVVKYIGNKGLLTKTSSQKPN